jgi:hydrogenase-4 membrane subunit HyfE
VGQFLAWCGFALLALAGGLVVARSARVTVGYYAAASVVDALMAGVLGVTEGRADLLVTAVMYLVAKAWVGPHLVLRFFPPETRREHSAALRLPPLALLAAGIPLLWVVFTAAGGVGSSAVLPFGAALAALCVALTAPAVRYELWSAAGGLLVGEDAIIACILVLVRDFPLAVDAVLVADILFLSAILSLMGALVAERHGAADARHLGRLRG